MFYGGIVPGVVKAATINSEKRYLCDIHISEISSVDIAVAVLIHVRRIFRLFYFV